MAQRFHLQEEDSSIVLDAITTGVGLAAYFQQLDGLFGSDLFSAALHGPKASRPLIRNGQKSEQSNLDGKSSSLQNPQGYCSLRPGFLN